MDTGRSLAEHKGEAIEAKRGHKENKDVIKQLKEELRLQQVCDDLDFHKILFCFLKNAKITIF